LIVAIRRRGRERRTNGSDPIAFPIAFPDRWLRAAALQVKQTIAQTAACHSRGIENGLGGPHTTCFRAGLLFIIARHRRGRSKKARGFALPGRICHGPEAASATNQNGPIFFT